MASEYLGLIAVGGQTLAFDSGQTGTNSIVEGAVNFASVFTQSSNAQRRQNPPTPTARSNCLYRILDTAIL